MSWGAVPIATALRRAWAKGYRAAELRADVAPPLEDAERRAV